MGLSMKTKKSSLIFHIYPTRANLVYFDKLKMEVNLWMKLMNLVHSALQYLSLELE